MPIRVLRQCLRLALYLNTKTSACCSIRDLTLVTPQYPPRMSAYLESFVPDGVVGSQSNPLRNRAVLLLRFGELLLGAERLVRLVILSAGCITMARIGVAYRHLDGGVYCQGCKSVRLSGEAVQDLTSAIRRQWDFARNSCGFASPRPAYHTSWRTVGQMMLLSYGRPLLVYATADVIVDKVDL